MRVAKEGSVFYLPSLALFLITLVLDWWLASLFFLLLSAAFIFFFRDPERRPPQDQKLVLSPADGRVIKIEEFSHHPEIGGPGLVVSIFLSLLDVHFTRSPLAATVTRVDYQPGKFFPAYREEAGSQNEANSLVLATDRGRLFLKQMVGVAARRIKCYVKPGDRVAAGQKIGLMYFGSRVDLYLPASVELKVSLNQKVKGGLSLIGEWRDESKD
ncbi:MAG: phosphatidylserine decarboxylase [Candidatus Saccharicenans sp.]|jgi:phosphatidylserine decarboxylase|nr:phosphatidylserine decarboxylase [Candidatus Saccharicenans sp.]MDH7492249.1 phosphatidylserine decarboxylase [Candidatus Saccharicenans sp.]